MLEGVTLEMKPTEETPPCIKKGGFGRDRRVTLRFKRNSSMLEERGYSYALVLPVEEEEN